MFWWGIWEIYGFQTQLYKIWKPGFNMKSNIAIIVGSIFCAKIALPGHHYWSKK